MNELKNKTKQQALQNKKLTMAESIAPAVFVNMQKYPLHIFFTILFFLFFLV